MYSNGLHTSGPRSQVLVLDSIQQIVFLGHDFCSRKDSDRRALHEWCPSGISVMVAWWSSKLRLFMPIMSFGYGSYSEKIPRSVPTSRPHGVEDSSASLSLPVLLQEYTSLTKMLAQESSAEEYIDGNTEYVHSVPTYTGPLLMRRNHEAHHGRSYKMPEVSRLILM